jgi:hypothetical protein
MTNLSIAQTIPDLNAGDGCLMAISDLQHQFEVYQDTLIKLRKANQKLTKFQHELIQRCLTTMIHHHNIIFKELDSKMKKHEITSSDNKV